MIPKIIHYCWFGKKKIPHQLKKYMRTWKKFCPDYKIICWNESNYDINKIVYTKEAAELQKWAFVTDYARLDIIEQYGGIYLDTDVELCKSFDSLLLNKAFCGFECSGYIAFGLGFGAEPHNTLIKEMKKYYEERSFKKDYIRNEIKTCPIVQTEILTQHGLEKKGIEQIVEGIHIYPVDYFCPMNYSQILDNFTGNTYSIHHYSASWFSRRDRFNFFYGNWKNKLHLLIKKIFGEKWTKKIKDFRKCMK